MVLILETLQEVRPEAMQVILATVTSSEPCWDGTYFPKAVGIFQTVQLSMSVTSALLHPGTHLA